MNKREELQHHLDEVDAYADDYAANEMTWLDYYVELYGTTQGAWDSKSGEVSNA